VSRLEELGFAAAIFPALTAMTAMSTMETALRHLAETGESSHPGLPVYDFEKACRLFGFDSYRELAKSWDELE
jgi:2-methylisocitrate lyase-like PEP mutase family enzyme